ncbi:MAG: hypothetical protein AB1637_03275 [Elusimicrobiota bacterium]
MKKNEDLKSLLEQLKAETSYFESETEENPQKTQENILPVKNTLISPPQIQKTYQSPILRNQVKEIVPPARFNAVWSENKESLLFGLLASACVILIGIFSEKEYVILAGTVSFMLFSIVSFAAFFRYVIASSYKEPIKDISQRSEIREKFYNQSLPMSSEKERELEGKIEELRSIVKALSRQQDKNI